ncbi:tyrosine-type recombinase/integrase [Perlucidibaca aquatica]|uniref:tyrosine-type recombinase/integrase n=1 Tax=Perlucidibaca aquatica TaxID=1852776 RepID=UPI00083A4EE3|nr:integrase arm-type DNA-binding domain-containing protein [Perlucidibaca aquatica]
MPTNALTDARCKGAKASDKPYKLFDGGGLHLYVSTTGSRTWRLAYRLAGKPQTMSLGSYPEITLAAARVKREEVKRALIEGHDPMAPRRVNRQGMTLAEATDTYWQGRKDVSATYRTNALRGIELHLVRLMPKPIGSITRDDLLGELLLMDAAGLHVYVRKVRMWVGQVFEWAVENGIANINPAALIRPEKAFGRAKVTSFAALALREVPEFLERLAMEGDLQSVLACRLLALTWVRTNELRMMEWSEVDEAAKVWLIPAGKMKRDRDHLVPLSSQSLAVLKQLRARSRPEARYVFSAPHRMDRPMSENAVLTLIARMGYRGRMTGHGWRSVASTWANENGYSPDAIERQLAHVPDNKIRAVYNRAEYLPDRKKLLQDWADWLDSCGLTPA